MIDLIVKFPQINIPRVGQNLKYLLIENKIPVEEIILYEENILNTIQKPNIDLSCPICLGITRNPITCDICDDAYCTSCIDNHLKKSNQCPSCKENFKKRKNRRISASLKCLIFKCPLECSESKYNEVDSHLSKTCSYIKKIYECSLCSNKLIAKGLEDSEIKNHDKFCPQLKFNMV